MGTDYFYNTYNKKNDEELKQLLDSNDHTNDAKLCAIKILVSRGHAEEELLVREKSIRDEIFDRRSDINYRERYDTGGARFGALILDGIVLSVAGWFIELFYFVDSVVLLTLIGIIEVLLPYAYSIIMHGYCGQTIGKMAANVKIYDKSEEKKITYKQALYREIVPLGLIGLFQLISLLGLLENTEYVLYAAFFVMAIALTWSILEIVTMLFDSKRRALHDHIAGTVVLKIHSR
ncbi:RDD family protein [Carboxylicivirga sp. RSCT41]|uniref:RDD family protein n=1 Tax=Carboxylicivirga agarovorans TaxID=3417570 RepID=UPI003D344853